MKANELRDFIRPLVAEEVQKQLPKLLFEMLGQQPKAVIRESATIIAPKISSQQPITPQQPKPIKRYAKNPMLNAVLNETVPGLPATPYGNMGIPIPDFNKVGVSEEFMGNIREIMNENVSVPTNTPEPETGTAGIPNLANLFNKDFKSILEKSKKIKPGGMMM